MKVALHLLPRISAMTFFMLALLAPWAQAQVNLEVSVQKSDEHLPVQGAEVFLRNEETGFASSEATNHQGKARFNGLSTSGSYSVRVSASQHYHEARSSTIRLRANTTKSIVLLLIPVSVSVEQMTVTRNSFTHVNHMNAEVSSTLRQLDLEALPVEGHDLTRSLFRLPNVSQATGFYPEAPNVSINGANSLFTNYMIDGLDNNENFLGGQKFPTPLGVVRSVTVLSNNYSTEFGRTGNGVINVTTRSGNNFLSGEVYYTTRPGSGLDAKSPHAQRDLSGNQVKDGFRRHQAGVRFGGPIKSNRTFFFFDLERTADSKDNLLTSPAIGVSETVKGNNDFSYLSGKIDHNWSPDARSSLRLNVSQVDIERQGGGLEGGVIFPSAANRQERDAHLIALRNTITGDGFVYEGNLQQSRFHWNYADPANPNSPRVTVLDSRGVTSAVLGHPGYIFESVENSWQLQQKIGFVGLRHFLKLGVDLILADFDLTGGGNIHGNYLVGLSAQQEALLRWQNPGAQLGIDQIPADVAVLDYAVELQAGAFGDRQNLYSLYVEDLYSVNSKLNLTLGLRYDYDSLSKAGNSRGDENNIAPRFSFNYAVNERAALRGGYGWFYEKIPYAVHSDALQQSSTAAGFLNQLQTLIDLGILPANTDLDRVTFDGNLTVNPTGVTYLQGPTSPQDLRATSFSNERRILNPNGLRNPRTRQFSAGYQIELNHDTLFYVDLMHTRSQDLLRLRSLNAPSSYQLDLEQLDGLPQDRWSELVRSTQEANTTRPVAPVPGGARDIVITESGGESRYSAANLNLIKERGEDPYAYRFSYTLSRLKNNTEDINFRAQDGNNFEAEWGPSINDRTHIISSIFYYYPSTHLSLSLAGLSQSGQPINRTPDAALFGTSDLNGDGRSFGDAYVGNSDRYPGAGRNSDRLGWSSTFDLSIRSNWPLFGRRFEVSLDIFNLLNAENRSGYANHATQSNQIQVGAPGSPIVHRNAGPPRQFQLGARIMF